MPTLPIPIACVSLACMACSPTSEDAFVRGKAYDPCIQVIPACPGIHARCVLDETRYTDVSLPADLSFVVKADPESVIEVLIFLKVQQDAGLETFVYWNEPGCSDVYTFDSGGRNLFEEAEDDNVISVSNKVYEGGEHLVEIISDMQAQALVSVDVHEPESQ